MSLFDVIKYPLSDPPTREQIHRLPIEIVRSVYLTEKLYEMEELSDPTDPDELDHLDRLNLYDYLMYKVPAATPIPIIKFIREELLKL